MRLRSVVFCSAAACALVAQPAAAHTGREVGEYHLTVGWGTEPAFAGQPNSVQLILTDHDDRPVTDLGDTVRVAVTTGSAAAKTFAMEPHFRVGAFGTPGDYRAFFFPTRPGRYTFHFTGTIKGQRIDQKFTSSDTTFDDQKDPAGVSYPVADPAVSQLSDRVERVDTRVAAAQDASDNSKMFGIIGIVVGALGLLVAAFAMTRARKTTA